MRGPRISVWMALLSTGAVLLVAAALVPSGLALLRRLASEVARSKVELALIGALERLERRARSVEASARSLADGPTLLAQVSAGRPAELLPYLERFRLTAELDGCAVLTGGRSFAAAPPDLPWERYAQVAGEGFAFVDSTDPERRLDAVARVPLAGIAGGSVLAVGRLDGDFARELEAQVGIVTRILSDPGPTEPEVTSAGGAWRGRRSLSGAAGGSPAGVEVVLPVSEVLASIRPEQRTLVLLTLLASLLVTASGILAARHLARPLALLRSAAERIGAGDLATPVPPAPGPEAGALASTMEAMRRRLRAARAESREREAEAKALLEGIVEGVFAVDGERRIQFMNAQAARLLGVAPEDALGRFCGDVLRPLDRDGRRPCDQACPIVHARSRGSSRAIEQVVLPTGRRTLVLTSAPPAGTRQVQLIRDETELEAARRSRDAVLANVSHELKTPLSAQLASIELLRSELERGAPSPAALELTSSLERSTLRLTRLIDNLLESVRIETGQGGTRRVPVDLAAVAHDAGAMIEPLLRQRGQTLAYELPFEMPPVSGDPTQIAQVMTNLLANAHKFAPDGSVIRVGGSADGRTCSIWIDDAGPGVPATQSQSVFDRYYRVDPGAAEGLGLGLWIVKSIAERHGGRVEVGASPLGGSRFTLSLPAGGRE